METNKRFQIRTIKRTSGRGLKPLPSIEDAPWLNDTPPHPRPVQASPSFVGVEQVETVPLIKLVDTRPHPTCDVASDTRDRHDTHNALGTPCLAEHLGEAISSPSDEAKRNYLSDGLSNDKLVTDNVPSVNANSPVQMGSIGPKHPLWPLLLQMSKRLWNEVYQAEKSPSVEHVRQHFLTLLRSEPAIAKEIAASGNTELLFRCVVNEVLGYGPLESLLQDEDITEIIVNGPYQISMKRDGILRDTAHNFIDEQHLLRIIENMLRRSGSETPVKKPLLDIVLPPSLATQAAFSPSGAHAVKRLGVSSYTATIILPPVSAEGPIVLLRRRVRNNLSIATLLEQGTLNQAMADMLLTSVKARHNIIICGEQATGKTTILNALAAFIAEQERSVCVETVSELILRQKGNISLVANHTGPDAAYRASQVTLCEVLHYALLLRPTYLLLGECCGDETQMLLQAMYQGQSGVMTTMFASSIHDCLERLEQHYQRNSEHVTVEVARNHLANIVDVIIFLAKEPDASIKIQNIVKIVGVEKQHIKVQSLFYKQQAIIELGKGSQIEHS